MMKKTITCRNFLVTAVMALALALCLTGCASTPNSDTQNAALVDIAQVFSNVNDTNVSNTNTNENQEPLATSDAPDTVDTTFTVGIAWRADSSDSGYRTVAQVYRNLGCNVVLLPEVTCDEFSYDSGGGLTSDYISSTGMLSSAAAQVVKNGASSNAATVMDGVDMVVFTGGDDISPTLRASGSTDATYLGDCAPTRDVSDYLLMAYCLEHDIPQLCLCRGAQMLAVVSGADLIDDIPTYFAEQGVGYNYTHGPLRGTSDDYIAHEVIIDDAASILASLCDTLDWEKAPTWHHQGITGVTDATHLRVTAHNETSGISIIEGIERTDQSLCVGVQFHPEISLRDYLNGWTNTAFSDPQLSLDFFSKFLAEAKIVKSRQ